MKDISTMLRLQARRYYSPQHIKAAALFTRQSYQIEEDYKNNGVVTDELIEDHRSYVTGAIFAAASFLEATINEVFSDTLEHPESDVTVNIDPATKLLLAKMWKLNVPRTSSFDITRKFQIALTLAGKPLLDTGSPPYEDIRILITIRNELTHFEPMWERGEDTIPLKDVISDLRPTKPKGKSRFLFNPLVGTSAAFFPDKCLSHGCAEWAVKKSIDLVTLFSSRIGSTLLFDANSPRLKTTTLMAQTND